MRAVRSRGAGVEVVEEAEPAGDGVVVHVRSAGICGSDLHLIGWGPLPITIGHEVAGLLDDGTPVAIVPLVPCGSCDRCLAGEDQQCRTGAGRVYGIGAHGGMADRMLVDRRNVIPLPSSVRAEGACVAEPIGCSVHAFRRASCSPRSSPRRSRRS